MLGQDRQSLVQKRNIIDIPTIIIAIVTIFSLLYIKKIQEPYIIFIAAVAGVFIKLILI